MNKALTSALFTSLLLAACSTGTPTPDPTDQPAQPEPTTPPPSLIMDIQNQDHEILTGKHNVVIKTSMGDIAVELDADAAPKTVTNFIVLAQNGYYDNMIFHRVINNFMIQGGDPTGTGRDGESIWGSTFEDEINAETYDLHTRKLADLTDDELPDDVKDWSLKQYYEQQGYSFRDDLRSLPMKKGAVAMANRGAGTNGSQFFIIQTDETPWLEGKHTVFGTVTSGIEVVDRIAQTQTGQGGKPLEDVTFSVEVAE